jgi:ubiquinone/menaquinone biosynthesis C-methylase UbiE
MTLPTYATIVSSFAEMYERSLVGPLFRPWAEVLLQQANLKTGDRVLDLACGTGIVARIAKERLGATSRVVGVDVSAPMLAVARAIAPSIDWREGNVTAVPVDGSETFDVVTCQQGLQFCPDKPAVAREMRRVIAPEGTLAVATWRSLEEILIYRDLHRVAERHVGPIVDQRYSFGDATTLQELFVGAGFHDARIETMSRTARLPDAALFVHMNTVGLVRMSAASTAMADEERDRVVGAIVSESREVLRPYSVCDGLAFEMRANILTARV